MITLQLLDAKDTILSQATGEASVSLTVERDYAPGDRLLLLTDAAQVYAAVDPFLPPAYLYIPEGRFAFAFPTEPAQLEAYAPHAFRAGLHTYTACAAPEAASAYRDLALNPLSQRAFAGAYPFASANVETRDEPVFFARNVIDGCTQNHSHGIWPYQSWGIGLSETAECRIDFGREVDAERMVLTLRADFPHDAYWKQATVTLSDGSEYTFSLEMSDKGQSVDFGGVKRISWLKLHSLVKQVMDSPFPALTAWEVWGRG